MDDLIVLGEVIRCQIHRSESKLFQDRHDFGRIFPVRTKMDIKITGRAWSSMESQCIAPNDQIINFVCVQQLEQRFEVGVEFQGIVPSVDRLRRFALWWNGSAKI